jgi:putative transposase
LNEGELLMELSKNSVWEFKGSDLTEDSIYRVLDIMRDVESVILFPLNKSLETIKPVAISMEGFIEQVKSHKAKKSSYTLPKFLLVAEDKISEGHLARRDKNYNLIKSIVVDRSFLFDYATKKRTPYLVDYARKVGLDRKSLARLLTLYWRYGQDKMALLPAFSQSGALGKERKPTNKPLGSPKQPRTLAVERAEKYVIYDTDKIMFKQILKKYHLKESGMTLVKTYKKMLMEKYPDVILHADACGKAPLVPTLKQFRYWSKKLFSKDEVIKKRTSENDYLRNKRGLLGCVTQNSFLPGTHFEIDATVADVHIVSEYDSQRILGRPTIYIVADRASRMIVGMHVSIYHASWRAARQALANCFLPKSDYCQGFEIDISNSKWPCAHIPKELVCDNGEMVGLKPREALTPMTKLSFTPPYRPDEKGVVEKRFDILNKEVIHDFLGTTKGGKVVRGSRDPRKDAIYTLKEVTVEIIKAVLEHNSSIFSDLAFSSPLLVENDLSPTPVNYWKIHIQKHKHELQSANSDEIIARLLPPAEVSMTRCGIQFNNLYYSCQKVEDLDLASIARTSGQWRLEARIDENTTNYIYVRLDKNQGFTRCSLLPRSRMFSNKTMIEAIFLQDWLDLKKELAPITVASIDDHKQRTKMTKVAKQRSKNAKSTTFADKIKNVRENRQEELEATTNILTPKKRNQKIDSTLISNVIENKVVTLPHGRKRKIKGDKL